MKNLIKTTQKFFTNKTMPLIAIASLGLFFSNSALSLTLEQSVSKAMLIEPNLKQTFSRFKAILADKRYSEGDYYLTLTLTAGAGVEKYNDYNGRPLDDDANVNQASLVLRQSIFSGLSTYYDVGRLGHEAQAERLKLFAEAELKSMDVIEVYLKLIAAKKVLKLSELNQEDHYKIYKDVKVKVVNQLSPQFDLSQVESRLANARASTIAAQNRVADLNTEYSLLVGEFADNLSDPKPNSDFIPNSKAEALEYAAINNFSIQSAKEDIEAVKKEHKAAAANHYPEFYIEANANYDNIKDATALAYPNQGQTDEFKVMLKMELELFGGGKTSSRIDASKWRKQEAIDLLASVRRQIKQSVIQAWSSYELLGQQVNYLQENVGHSANAVKGYEEQFKVGRRELLDLLIAKTDLFQARKSYIETSNEHKIITYRLTYYTGDLLKSLYIDFPTKWKEPES